MAPVVIGRVVARSTEKSQLLGQGPNPLFHPGHLVGEVHGQEEQEPDGQQQEEGRLIPDPEQVSYPVQQGRNRRGDG